MEKGAEFETFCCNECKFSPAVRIVFMQEIFPVDVDSTAEHDFIFFSFLARFVLTALHEQLELRWPTIGAMIHRLPLYRYVQFPSKFIKLGNILVRCQIALPGQTQ